MKNRYEKIRNIGIIYRQARQRANNLCRREFYPFYNRIKVPDIVDKILKLKNSSVYVDDMPGVYLDRIIKYLCVVTDDKNVFLYSDGTEKNSFYTAAYFADCNVLVHNCKELQISNNIYIPGEYVISFKNPNRKSAKYYSDIACYLKQKRSEYLSDYLKHLP